MAERDAARFVEGDDVRLELPTSIALRDADPSQIRGDVHQAVEYTAGQVHAWVTTIVEHAARVAAILDELPPTSRDGAVRVYGPHADDDGRDLAWLVRLERTEDGSRFAVYVGARDAAGQGDMDLLMTGELAADEAQRSGGFSLELDAVEAHPDMKGPDGELTAVGGRVEVTFTRDVETEAKTIDLDFQGVSVERLGYLDDDAFYSDDTYRYVRAADGAGVFHLSLRGEWDDHGWSGPAQETMTLEAAWNPDGAGRTRGRIVEVDGVGDMKHGDLLVEECFGGDGFLTWRRIDEAYALEAPGYAFGDPTSCALPEAALGG